MITLIARTSGAGRVALRQEIGTASRKKRRILGMKLNLGVAWILEQILKTHVRIGTAHRITESLVGMERDT